jgi:protein-L-isoaspartate O-methyltransferase
MSDQGQTNYLLGDSEQELERLAAQARLIEPITRGFLRDAGIGPGMRVLDVGTGVGDVAFLAAEFVGAGGQVVGVDRSLAAVATARARAAALSLRNVSFTEGDPATMSFERPFDAVVGRRFLQFQADPAATIRALAGHVRPGGVIVFHELDSAGASSYPPASQFDRCCAWWIELLRQTGVDHRMGIKLHASFLAAGLPAPSMRLEAFIGGGATTAGYLRFAAADLIRSVLPELVRLGVATLAEVDIDTLHERMLAEVIANESVIVGRSEIGAWARV